MDLETAPETRGKQRLKLDQQMMRHYERRYRDDDDD